MQKKNYFSHCFECTDIHEGDNIPVGGGFIGSSDAPWTVKADFGNCYPKFAELAEKNGKQFEAPGWQDWFKANLPDADPALATALQTFTTAFEAKRAALDTGEVKRRQRYSKSEGNCVPLSATLDENIAMCVEISLLAKKYLDEKGISSRLFSGEVMFRYAPDEVHEPTPHTFLIIEHKGQEFIFDPANPTLLHGNNAMFTLLKPRQSFASRSSDLEKNCLMIAAENLLTKQCTYYGVGDFGNIPESLIVHGSRSEELKGRSGGSHSPSP